MARSTCHEVERCVKMLRNGTFDFFSVKKDPKVCKTVMEKHMASSRDCPLFQKEKKTFKKIKKREETSVTVKPVVYTTLQILHLLKTYASILKIHLFHRKHILLLLGHSLIQILKTIHVPDSSKPVFSFFSDAIYIFQVS